MTFDELVNSITPEIYARLKRAVELGKWENGVKLSTKQREQSLQVIIAYDARHTDEPERVGFVETKPHQACGEIDISDWQPLNINQRKK